MKRKKKSEAAFEECVPVELEALCDLFDETPIPKAIYIHSHTGMIPPLLRGRYEVECITLGSGITQIAPFAFAGFINLRKIHIPRTLRVIGEYAFMNTPLEGKSKHAIRKTRY